MQDIEPLVRRYLYNLRKTQYLPPERLLAYQRVLLEQLVRHARTHVPFYRDTGRLDVLFRRDGTIDWGRWGEIPLLTRGEVQQAGDALRSETLPPEHGDTWAYSTSGSTGEPVTVWHSALFLNVLWTALLMRELEWFKINPARRLAFIESFEPTVLPTNGMRRHEGWFPGVAALGFLGERFDLNSMRNASELVDAVASLRPTYMRVQPLTLQLMRSLDPMDRLRELKLEAVLTIGEHLPLSVHKELEAHLGCTIADIYGSTECGRIAASCPHCGRFHVHAESNLLEVIADDGELTRTGETGWIVLTSLYNYSFPLIRYDHADRAQLGDLNGCRIRLPTLDGIFGKEHTAFVFRGGITIRPKLSATSVRELLGARVYQVAQVADDRCEFRIVPGTLAPAQMRFAEMTQVMRSSWWEGLQIEYRIVETIERNSARGKIALFLSEMKNPASGPEPGPSAADYC